MEKDALVRALTSTIAKKNSELLSKNQVIAQQTHVISSLQSELSKVNGKFGALQKLDSVSEKVRAEQRQLIASYAALTSLGRRTKLTSAHSVTFKPAQPSPAVKQEVGSAICRETTSWLSDLVTKVDQVQAKYYPTWSTDLPIKSEPGIKVKSEKPCSPKVATKQESRKHWHALVPRCFRTLFRLWTDPSMEVDKKVEKPVLPTVRPYPRVDWQRLAKPSFRDPVGLPDPLEFPLQGCAPETGNPCQDFRCVGYEDPDDESRCMAGNCQSVPRKNIFGQEIRSTSPFGTLPGYATTLGIVAPPTVPVNGRVRVPVERHWEWILQAQHPPAEPPLHPAGHSARRPDHSHYGRGVRGGGERGDRRRGEERRNHATIPAHGLA